MGLPDVWSFDCRPLAVYKAEFICIVNSHSRCGPAPEVDLHNLDWRSTANSQTED